MPPLVPEVARVLRQRGMHVYLDSRGRECVCLKHAAELLGLAVPTVKYYVRAGKLTWEQHASPLLGERIGLPRRIIPIAAIIRVYEHRKQAGQGQKKKGFDSQ